MANGAGAAGPQAADVLIESGDLAIRRMRDDPGDHRLMAKWLTDERVLAFYHGRDNPYDYARAAAKYGRYARAESPVRPCILTYQGKEIGYLQYYPAGAGEYQLEDATDTYGVDLFIGEPELWGSGVGTRALAALADHIFEELGAARIVTDPHVDNARAVRSYEKCGFRKVKVLREHELHEGVRRDCWLMVLERRRSG